MVKTVRIYLILLLVAAASIYIPKYYWMIFEEYIRPPFILYSPIIKDFLFTRYEGKNIIRLDNKGKELSREEYEKLEPLFFFRQALIDGNFPDSIDEKKIDVQEVRLNNISLRIRPKDLDFPGAGLYPLFESKSGRASLELPGEFFRINQKMEFINCEKNEIEKDLTELFTRAMLNEDFVFPASGIYGNPTTRKPFDEGYFVTDINGSLFHIKMIEGQPYCKKLTNKEELDVDYILVYENELKEFYGLIITRSNQLFFISYDNYKLIPLPVENYNRKENELMIRCNLFYRLIIIYGDASVNAVVTDRDYEKIDDYTESWKTNEELLAGEIANLLFPFSLSFNDGNSSIIDFYFDFSTLSRIIGILIALLLYTVIKFAAFRDFKNIKLMDIIIILFTGFFGLFGVLIIRDEE